MGHIFHHDLYSDIQALQLESQKSNPKFSKTLGLGKGWKTQLGV